MVYSPNVVLEGFVPHKQQSVVGKSVYELVKSSVAQICKVNQQSLFVLDEVEENIVNRTTALFGFLGQTKKGGDKQQNSTMLFRGSGWKFLDLSGFDNLVVIKEPELQLMKTSQVADSAALQKARAYDNLSTIEAIKVILQPSALKHPDAANHQQKSGYLITVVK